MREKGGEVSWGLLGELFARVGMFVNKIMQIGRRIRGMCGSLVARGNHGARVACNGVRGFC